jgi:hypothetical protein
MCEINRSNRSEQVSLAAALDNQFKRFNCFIVNIPETKCMLYLNLGETRAISVYIFSQLVKSEQSTL